jgi:hypothetical protein
MLNEDYKDILRALSASKARYLVIGAYAMSAYGYVRATGDFDIWVEPSVQNSPKVYKALKVFGAPLSKISEQTFASVDVVFQIGVIPRRIDIVTSIDGVAFQKAYGEREMFVIDRLRVPVLSKPDLIKNKASTGRPKDKMDAACLRKLRNR